MKTSKISTLTSMHEGRKDSLIKKQFFDIDK